MTVWEGLAYVVPLVSTAVSTIVTTIWIVGRKVRDLERLPIEAMSRLEAHVRETGAKFSSLDETIRECFDRLIKCVTQTVRHDERLGGQDYRLESVERRLERLETARDR